MTVIVLYLLLKFDVSLEWPKNGKMLSAFAPWLP